MTTTQEIVMKQTPEQAAIDYFGKSGSMCSARIGFVEGAEWQKERDRLTWEDIRNIYILIDRIDRKKYPPITVGFYEEILRQFNEIKGLTTITEIETVVQNR